MRISDEERRRVAKALREPSELLNIRVPIYEALDMPPDVAETLVSSEGVEHNNRRLLNRLADLIDLPKVKREDAGNYWLCGHCGAFSRKDAVTDCCGVIPSRCCGNCGREWER